MPKIKEQEFYEIYIRNRLGESIYKLSQEYPISEQAIRQRMEKYKPKLQYVVYARYHILNNNLSERDGWSNYGKWMITKIHCSISQETLEMKNNEDYKAFDDFLPYWHKIYISSEMEKYTKLYYMEEVDSIIGLLQGEKNQFYIYF